MFLHTRVCVMKSIGGGGGACTHTEYTVHAVNIGVSDYQRLGVVRPTAP